LDGEKNEDVPVSLGAITTPAAVSSNTAKSLYTIELRIIIKQARVTVMEPEPTMRVEFTRSGQSMSTT